MPILTLQKQSRELGRIRIGQKVPTSNGRSRPEKLDRFRLTSPSRPLLEKVAALYGGDVREWDNGGTTQYEVITDATRLPVLVPPQPVSQYFELWSGGGCQRRCDGQTELLSDRPCLCSPEPEDRECKPTTRLRVILRDVEGIGTWRLESHGYYSAVELPEVAEFLAQAGTYVSAWLGLEQRTAIRDGKTRRWMVPILEVDVTPAALLAGTAGNTAAVGSGAGKALPPAPPRELPAGKPELTEDEIVMATAQIADAVSVEQLRAIWKQFAAHFVIPDAMRAAFNKRVTELQEAAPTDDVDTLWHRVLTTAPEDWTTEEIENHVAETLGVDPARATAEDLRRYLNTRNQR